MIAPAGSCVLENPELALNANPHTILMPAKAGIHVMSFRATDFGPVSLGGGNPAVQPASWRKHASVPAFAGMTPMVGGQKSIGHRGFAKPIVEGHPA